MNTHIGNLVFDRSKWMVLIDAAKGCATQKVDLSRYPADFVVISFYKVSVVMSTFQENTYEILS